LAAYRVNLDIFAGPLDLLLYLVRKEEVDIYDIPIAKITDQYISYIEMLKSLDIDLAGDFLVMAATLMQIKSAMLLPQAEGGLALEGQEDDLSDPRVELIRQLLEYKKFKDAANLLSDAAVRQSDRFPRPDSIVERLKPDAEPQIDMEQVSIWDLLGAFDSIMKATGGGRTERHIKDDTPIDLYQIEILHRLQSEGRMSFECIFESGANRLVMIGLFLALLELIREKLVFAEQRANSSSIYLRSLTDEPVEEAVQKAILALAEMSDEKYIQHKRQEQPPIPISEVSPKDKSALPLDARRRQSPPIPIAELSPKGELVTSPNQQEKVEPVKDGEQQAAD
jgi:segregation and condensation protein A